MGNELWKSSYTGIRRKGTTYQEIQSIFIENITTKFIYEPLYSCPHGANAIGLRDELISRDFDVAGVVNEFGKVIGFCYTEELQEGQINNFLRDIDLNLVIADSTPITNLLNILSDNSFAFVISANQINGIVTLADINKPIVRIYLFGIISLFEMHLNFWINHHYDEDVWKQAISEKRLDKAIDIYNVRKGNNEDLSLLECLQFCDKRKILSSSKEFLSQMEFDVDEFIENMKNAENIRNELAHSQNSIISNLEFEIFANTIQQIESFLIKSEELVENGT